MSRPVLIIVLAVVALVANLAVIFWLQGRSTTKEPSTAVFVERRERAAKDDEVVEQLPPVEKQPQPEPPPGQGANDPVEGRPQPPALRAIDAPKPQPIVQEPLAKAQGQASKLQSLVKQYLLDSLHDPDGLEYLKWFEPIEVAEHDSKLASGFVRVKQKATMVRLRFRAKNQLGGKRLCDWCFYIKDGFVVDAMDTYPAAMEGLVSRDPREDLKDARDKGNQLFEDFLNMNAGQKKPVAKPKR